MKKHLHVLLISVSMGLLTGSISCKRNDPAPGISSCGNPALNKNLPGTWAATVTTAGTAVTGSVTFKPDSTFLDPNYVLLAATLGNVPLTQRTYSITGNRLTLSATNGPSSGVNAFLARGAIVDVNTCNRVEFQIGTSNSQVVLTR